jgi:N-acetyl sugar amidotransferase
MIDYKKIFDQKALEKDSKANLGRPFQRCSISVMDTIADPNITFDEKGVCNYYYDYKKTEALHVITGKEGQQKLAEDIKKIKDDSAGKKYDCILGLSGGVDSTYLCHLAKEKGLNPLVVHCDNGWNSELAQHNIENTVKRCGFDLFTYVINWEHFKEFQLAYVKASVVDIEVLTDHAFMAVLYEQARKWKIKYVLAGMNIVTEHVLPKYWIYNKADAVNIKAIQKKFGTKTFKELSTFPFLDYRNKKYCTEVLKMEVITPLNYIEYVYDDIKALIQEELGWRDYGGKHYESVWTRFYQGYLLPRKFNIDKRKAHLSNLIYSGQLTREEALKKLETPTYTSLDLMEEDLEYVIKKFGLTAELFEKIMEEPRREHTDYPTQKSFWEQYPFLSFLKPLRKLVYK